MERMVKEKVFTKPKSMYAMLLLGMFTFLFLDSEFLYVNRIALTVGEEKTVMVQNYALGVSAVGIFLYPLLQRVLKGRAQAVGITVIALAAAACNLLVQRSGADWFTLGAGMVLFLLLGLLGGAVHYLFFRLTEERDYLARMVGISYAGGILLQFLSNNFVKSEAAEAVILSLSSLAALALLLKGEQLCDRDAAEGVEHPLPPQKESGKGNRKAIVAGGLLALLVLLMACIFSTLDNAVTMHHVTGNDIGQWPRLLLAVSGVIAGFLFDIRKRKFMTTIMY